ncbi:MAG TPA: alpha/beta fold hydrolase [Azospirillaceae bacterium]|nr:alpha/beta fold hydrolase [Azospirillaceae bacterium]
MAETPRTGNGRRAGLAGWHGVLAWSDANRRRQGALLDLLGLGPERTPSRVVFARPGVRLRAFGEPRAGHGPVLLIVPAPIKRFYIWDLLPAVSVVRHCLDGGVRVYGAEWSDPVGPAVRYGLADYADRLLGECIDAMAAETGVSAPMVTGHSLGGTLAAIFTSLNPERVRALTLLEAPLRFGKEVGAFAPLLAVAPRPNGFDGEAPPIPGSLLNLASLMAAPDAFLLERWSDWAASLPDYQALRTHLRVERWTLDEYPMPARLFAGVVEDLYRGDHFRRGTLEIGRRRAALAAIACPIQIVADPRSRVIPPSSVVPEAGSVASNDARVLRYEGDRGVALQHVGALVGRNAHQRLWPEIIRWMRARWNGA